MTVGQMKRVWVSGITPLISNSFGGMAPLVAMSRAADEDNPRAQTAPNPK